MKQIPIFFVSGLPRSGSTLLMNLLAQNPMFHATPTNDLLELVVNVRNTWTNMISFKAQGIDVVKSRIISSIKGSIYGFFEKEFEEGKVVFDKSRGWLANIELLEEILGRQIKVIITVRDVRAIVSSFEKLHRKSQMTKISPSSDAFYDMQSINGRARQILNVQAVVGLAITRFRDALDKGLADRLIIIPYNKLTTQPKEIMYQLHDSLGLQRFEYDPDNVEQLTKEDDSVHGMELHKIRKKVKYQESDWDQILTPFVNDWISKEYEDINEIAKK